MVKLGPAFGLLSLLALVSASPVKRQDSTAASSTAADTAASTAADTAASTAASSAASTDSAATTSAASDAAASGSSAAPETTVTAFVPSGGAPNGTLYAVTGANETYLVGLQPVTATDSAGAATTATLEQIYAVSEDELDYYVFDGQGNVIAATECDISADGTTAECDGVVVDLTATAIAVFNNLTLSGASTGIPAYLPTGTVDPSGVSAASNAAALVSSFTAGGGVSASSVGSNTATGTITPTVLPGGSSDTSLPASAATESSAAESSASGTDSAAASTDTAAASTDTAAASTDTAAATTDTAAASTAAASAASSSA